MLLYPITLGLCYPRYPIKHSSLPPQVIVITRTQSNKEPWFHVNQGIQWNYPRVCVTQDIPSNLPRVYVTPGICWNPNPDYSTSWEMQILRNPNLERSKKNRSTYWQIPILKDPNLITEWPITLNLKALSLLIWPCQWHWFSTTWINPTLDEIDNYLLSWASKKYRM